MNRFFTLALMPLFLASSVAMAQETYKEKKIVDENQVYQGNSFHPVKTYPQKFKAKRPKNVILMIGDGMGVATLSAGSTANKGHLFLDNFKVAGFSRTQAADKYITDSAAGGTALSAGVKTYNGAIGVDVNQKPLKTILEEAEEKGLATGLVSTSAITHATPASFIAHQGSRGSYEMIAADFLKTDIDVFIGGGYKHFTKREDGRNLAEELKGKGYAVWQKMEDITAVESGKLAGLAAPEHMPRVGVRGSFLPDAVKTALRILDNNRKGFFIMIEGSQIDFGGHQNSATFVTEEMLDFDQAVGQALEFAARNGETLIVVTADHETGGVAITGGDVATGMVKMGFVSKDHTGLMVPVFAYGPGAEEFGGIMENTDINAKIKKLLIRK